MSHAAQSFGHHDAEVLLVGGRAEQLGAVEGSPLEGTIEHSGPGDAIGDAARCCRRGWLDATVANASISRSNLFLRWMRLRNNRMPVYTK